MNFRIQAADRRFPESFLIVKTQFRVSAWDQPAQISGKNHLPEKAAGVKQSPKEAMGIPYLDTSQATLDKALVPA